MTDLSATSNVDFISGETLSDISPLRSSPLPRKMSKILRVGQFGRTFTRGMAEYVKTVEERQHPVSNDTVKIFKFITYFVGVPLLGVAMVNCYIKILEESHEPAPEFIHYPYMKVMNKGFPWKDGKHSLFHNAKKNYVPGIGYEEE